MALSLARTSLAATVGPPSLLPFESPTCAHAPASYSVVSLLAVGDSCFPTPSPRIEQNCLLTLPIQLTLCRSKSGFVVVLFAASRWLPGRAGHAGEPEFSADCSPVNIKRSGQPSFCYIAVAIA
eukprot:scaffold150769_cov41-Prasinocladus_malaysianus.AAC.1